MVNAADMDELKRAVLDECERVGYKPYRDDIEVFYGTFNGNLGFHVLGLVDTYNMDWDEITCYMGYTLSEAIAEVPNMVDMCLPYDFYDNKEVA